MAPALSPCPKGGGQGEGPCRVGLGAHRWKGPGCPMHHMALQENKLSCLTRRLLHSLCSSSLTSSQNVPFWQHLACHQALAKESRGNIGTLPCGLSVAINGCCVRRVSHTWRCWRKNTPPEGSLGLLNTPGMLLSRRGWCRASVLSSCIFYDPQFLTLFISHPWPAHLKHCWYACRLIARLLQAHEAINNLPSGWQRQRGGRGGRLSAVSGSENNPREVRWRVYGWVVAHAAVLPLHIHLLGMYLQWKDDFSELWTLLLGR